MMKQRNMFQTKDNVKPQRKPLMKSYLPDRRGNPMASFGDEEWEWGTHIGTSLGAWGQANRAKDTHFT